MHYTVHRDPRIARRVERDLETIKSVLLAQFDTITALILIGGFGRGEGSVLLEEGGIVTPINDYDVLVIYQGGINKKTLGAQQPILSKKIGIWLIDLIAIDEKVIAKLPFTQLNYDSGKGGHLFWGKSDILEQWPRWNPAEMPLAEGKRILFNRFVSILEAPGISIDQERIDSETRFFLANQTSKALLACCDAILMTQGCYEYRYRHRASVFRSMLADRTADVSLIEQACDFKLRPSMPPGFDTAAYWRQAMKLYHQTLTEFLPQFYGRTWQSQHEFSRFYTSPLRIENWLAFGKDFARSVLGRRRAYTAILHLEMAAFHLITAWNAGSEKESYLTSAWQHLQQSGYKIPVHDRSWDTARQAVVEQWYEIKH